MSYTTAPELADMVDLEHAQAYYVVIVKKDQTMWTGFAFADDENSAYHIVRKGRNIGVDDISKYACLSERQMAKARKVLMKKELKV